MCYWPTTGRGSSISGFPGPWRRARSLRPAPWSARQGSCHRNRPGAARWDRPATSSALAPSSPSPPPARGRSGRGPRWRCCTGWSAASPTPPVAYPPRDNAPERVPTASRPELRPVYDGQLTHTQGRWDQPSAEPESRFDRPIASPVPPWDSRAAAPVRHRPAHRGWLIAAAAAAVLASVGAGAFVAGKIVPGHGASAASGSPSPAGATSSVANSGSPCGSDPGQDSHYAAGVNISNAATTAKDAFVAIWDPMAPRYGQQVY